MCILSCIYYKGKKGRIVTIAYCEWNKFRHYSQFSSAVIRLHPKFIPSTIKTRGTHTYAHMHANNKSKL